MTGTMTVRENLMFSASLRLPDSVSRREKRRRVEETLVELGLTECADNKVKVSQGLNLDSIKVQMPSETCNFSIILSTPVADPGFPVGGRGPRGGRGAWTPEAVTF